ncbi:MAG: hypothetical protein H6636_06965 [Anaerolineales bacterium]|nr:hypothetical protein [Anaerolineales bacterium]
MADVNQVITLGIGTPGDIPHFILLGLTPEGSAPPFVPPSAGAQGGWELYIRHYDRDGVLKNPAIAPLWCRFTLSVDQDEPVVFALTGQHPAIAATLAGAGNAFVEFDIIEVLVRNRGIGITDWTRAAIGILRSFEIETDDNLITTWTMYAPQEKHILSWRHVLWHAGFNNRSTFDAVPAETIMKTVVQYNATSDASIANGRWREGDLQIGMGVTVTIEADDSGGQTLSASFVGANVLAILGKLAAQAEGDFSLAWAGAGTSEWLFTFHPGQMGADKSTGSGRVLFSLKNGTMSNPRLKLLGATATAAISAGEGEGAKRQVSEVTGADFAADADIEIFVDARQAKTPEMRVFRGQERLHESRVTRELTFDVIQTSDIFYAPVEITGRKTYRTGDLVLAEYPPGAGTEVRKIIAITVDWQVRNRASSWQVRVDTQIHNA